MAVFATAVAWAAHIAPGPFSDLSATPFTLFGIALSIFLSFRNSACYDRWWEARRVWGQIIFEIRSLARQTVDLEPSLRAPLLRNACGFAHALCATLRGEDPAAAGAPWTDAPLTGPNVCDTLLSNAGKTCLDLYGSGRIDGWRYQLLEARLNALSSALAACEKIKTTPIPFAYSLLLHRTAYLFCLMLPFGLVSSFGFATPVITAVISYTFFGLDRLGDELEDPFGLEANDLPLDALVRTVERDVLAALGSADLPPALEPDRYVLT